jgi:hypothetical protein
MAQTNQPTPGSPGARVQGEGTEKSQNQGRPGGSSEGGAVAQQAKEVVSHVAGEAREVAKTQLATRAERSASDLEAVAKALRESSDRLEGNMASPYVKRAADRIERVSSFIQNTDVAEIPRKVEDFARREPLLFLGGAFTLGILGVRFLKSSARDVEGSARSAT